MCEEKKRRCRICKQYKRVDLFEIDSRHKDKHTNRCKSCKNDLDDKASRTYRRLRLRSKKLGIPMEVTTKEIRLLLNVFDGCCGYCSKRPEKARNLHLDHLVPTSENGRNTLANLIPACNRCNSSKGAKPVVTHFLNEKVPDGNMALVIAYISLISGSTKEDVVAEMTDDHIAYLWKQLDEEDAKLNLNGGDYGAS
jgi:5-methylcytosine-specific restriction endonuclease McrA